MEIITVLFNQILMMFLLMFLGVWLFRSGKLSLEGSKSLGNILLYLVIPAVVIKAYLAEMTAEKLQGLAISFGVSFLALGLAMLVSHLCFKKLPIENFGASFSNAGFIGIPLVSMLFGDEAVFYVSAFVALVNILQWTYGVFVMTGNTQAVSLKRLMLNPILLALAAGLVIFIFQIPLPGVITSCIQSVSGLNAPLAMFSLGTYLAQMPLKAVFTSKVSWLCTLVRLVLIPLLTLLLLGLIPIENVILKQTILIVAATPVGSNVAIFAQIHQQDYQQAVKDVCLSTLCSIVTLPVLLLLAGFIW